MARKLTKEAIRKVLTKGLTGWEGGKLVMQDFADESCGKRSFLTEGDIAQIRAGLKEGKDTRDYNNLMAMGRGIEKGLVVCSIAWPEACLDLCTLTRMLRDANKKNAVELFMSSRPHVVTPKQYQDIVAAQREKKLAFEYSLAYIIEERFYAIAPSTAREEIDELGLDIESAESFAAAVPKKYANLHRKAVAEIHRLYVGGKLNAAYHDEDAKMAKSMSGKWKKKKLSDKETMKLADMLFVTGQELYDCDELPEWKDYMDKYHQYLFYDEDERFQYAYATLQDCPEFWTDENGYYKDPFPTSEWIVRETELILGLRALDGEKTKSFKSVKHYLLKILTKAKLNIRTFLAVKAIIDVASQAVGVSFSGETGGLESVCERMGRHVMEYNRRLKGLKEEHPWCDSNMESKLEKVLKMLPSVNLEKLKPSAASMQLLKDNVMNDLTGEEWLREKVLGLEYDDGFSFMEFLPKE